MRDDMPDGGARRRQWFRRPLLLAGTAAIALAAGAGIAIAATSGPSSALSAAGSLSAAASSPSAPSAQPALPGCARVVTPARTGVLCRRPGLGGALHGTLIVPKPGGGTMTIEIQNGKVTAVSQSSITLKSTDGFAKTYAVTASTIVSARRDGIGSVKAGDQVWVTATASGGTVTAISVSDLSQLQSGSMFFPRFGPIGTPQPGMRSGLSGGPGGWTASVFGDPAGG